MIKSMQRKVIVVASIAMLIILMVIFITINVYMNQTTDNQIESFIQDVLDNDGLVGRPIIGEAEYRPEIPPEFPGRDDNPEMPPGGEAIIRGFVFQLSKDGQLLELHTTGDSLEEADLLIILESMDIGDQESGSIAGYRYKMKSNEEGYLVVMADSSVQNNMLEGLLFLSYVMGAISFVLVVILITYLSRFIIRPVEVAFEKQKRFISDSSHELKTPLSIISANVDMLELEQGKNTRTDAISDGIKRMNSLIHELLILARTEYKQHDFHQFNLSDLMEQTILPMEVIAYEQGNEIVTYIDEEVILNGDKESIRKMIGALMENAIKYSRKDTQILAKLYSEGEHHVIEVYNEGIGVSKEQKDKLFDNFYRVDRSRNRLTGGHGIGLSIVKNVVDMHKGKIIIDSVENEYIVFRITFKK